MYCSSEAGSSPPSSQADTPVEKPGGGDLNASDKTVSRCLLTHADVLVHATITQHDDCLRSRDDVTEMTTRKDEVPNPHALHAIESTWAVIYAVAIGSGSTRRSTHHRFRSPLFLVPGYNGGIFNPLSRNVIFTSGHFRFC